MRAIASSLILLLSISSVSAVERSSDGAEAAAESRPLVLRSSAGLLFVSDEAVTLLLHSPATDLGLSEEDREKVIELHDLLIRAERSLEELGQLTPSGCILPPLHWDRSPFDPGSMALQDLVDAAPAALIGRIVWVVPGVLPAAPGELVSAVFVEVEETKKQAVEQEPLRDEIFYFQFAGTIQFGEETICSENEGYYEARVGDRLLLLGNTHRGIPGLFRQNQAFELGEDGRVQEESLPSLEVTSRLPKLSELEF